MDQQGCGCPYSHSAQRRLRRDHPGEEGGEFCSEEIRHRRLLLSLPSEHESHSKRGALIELKQRSYKPCQKNETSPYDGFQTIDGLAAWRKPCDQIVERARMNQAN